MTRDLIATLKQSEYTGSNRCEPCTLLNLVIAGVLSSAIARKSKIGGVLAGGIALALIYLRGYLVPGTPKLTKKYLPPEVLSWFGKDPVLQTQQGFGSQNEGVTGGDNTPKTDETASNDDMKHTAVDPETYLLNSGILVLCSDQDDFCLERGFEKTWQAKIEAINIESVSAVDAATAFGLTTDDEYTIESYGQAQVLSRDGDQLGQWPSQAALVADVAAARVLEESDSDWNSLPPETKGQLLNALRLFLKTCPTSSGDVNFGTETVESCCQSYDVVAAECEDTGERLFEQPIDES